MVFPWSRWSRWAGIGLALLVGTLADSRSVDGQTGQEPAGGGGAPVALGPGLTVRSRPPGAVVVLDGPFKMVGVTPWTIERDLSGVYKVEIRAPGYSTWRGETVLAPGIGNTLDVDLSAKYRIGAIGRSALVPGWGQRYLGDSGKGRVFLALTILAGAGLATTHVLYQEEVDDFDAAAERYEKETSLDQLPALRSELRAADREADRAYDRRQYAGFALAGIYGVSLLDAIFFTPLSGPNRGIALDAAPDADGARVSLAYRW